MIDFLTETGLPVTLIAIALWRAPSIRAGRAQRSLCLAIGTVGIALSFDNPALESPLHRLHPGLPVLATHLFGIAFTVCLLDYLYAVHGRGLRGRLHPSVPLALIAAAAMVGLFLTFPLEHTEDAYDIIDAHLGETRVNLYLGIFYAYLGAAMALSTVVFWRSRAAVPRGLARNGVRLLAAGTATGVTYTAVRVVQVIGETIDLPVADEDLATQVTDVLKSASLLLVILGLSIPPLRGLVRYAHDQHALWRLHPLWSDITREFPHLAIGEPRSRMRELFTLGDRSLDVAHQAFGIRDAMLSLQPWAGAAGAHPAAAGPDATTEALWVKAALRRKSDGQRPETPGASPAEQELRAPRTEIRWAKSVAAAYRKTGS